MLVTKTGVKLFDFGLAKAIQPDPLNGMTVSAPLTGAGTILGTPQYMSPEQLQGTETDARTDIFAFGLILYELISGRRAFEAKSGASLIASILKDQPPPISEIAPLTPKGIDRVVATCLDKDPDDRWQSAREIRHALDWMTTESVSFPAAGSAERNAESGPSSRRWDGRSGQRPQRRLPRLSGSRSSRPIKVDSTCTSPSRRMEDTSPIGRLGRTVSAARGSVHLLHGDQHLRSPGHQSPEDGRSLGVGVVAGRGERDAGGPVA